MKVEIIQIFTFLLLPVLVTAKAELPDPTRPPTYEDNVEPIYVEVFDENEKVSWKVSAIRISEKDKTAIVNGKLVRVGDDINQAKILEIKPMSVVIGNDDQKFIVKLFNNQVFKDYNSSK